MTSRIEGPAEEEVADELLTVMRNWRNSGNVAAIIDQAAAEIARLRQRLEEVENGQWLFVGCPYCGWTDSAPTVEAGQTAVREHVTTCAAHPMRKLEAALDLAKAERRGVEAAFDDADRIACREKERADATESALASSAASLKAMTEEHDAARKLANISKALFDDSEKEVEALSQQLDEAREALIACEAEREKMRAALELISGGTEYTGPYQDSRPEDDPKPTYEPTWAAKTAQAALAKPAASEPQEGPA